MSDTLRFGNYHQGASMNIHEQSNSKPNSESNLNGAGSTMSGELYWQRHIEQHTESDLSKAEYARKHGLNYAKFLYWCDESSLKAISNRIVCNNKHG